MPDRDSLSARLQEAPPGLEDDARVVRLQQDAWRNAPPARRWALVMGLTTGALHRSRNALRRLHPDWSERDVLLHWAELNYGPEAAARIRAALQLRR